MKSILLSYTGFEKVNLPELVYDPSLETSSHVLLTVLGADGVEKIVITKDFYLGHIRKFILNLETMQYDALAPVDKKLFARRTELEDFLEDSVIEDKEEEETSAMEKSADGEDDDNEEVDGRAKKQTRNQRLFSENKQKTALLSEMVVRLVPGLTLSQTHSSPAPESVELAEKSDLSIGSFFDAESTLWYLYTHSYSENDIDKNPNLMAFSQLSNSMYESCFTVIEKNLVEETIEEKKTMDSATQSASISSSSDSDHYNEISEHSHEFILSDFTDRRRWMETKATN
ncbi:Protein CBG25403 [Caenorhabditis briggsae]|uniref:Protein CBG25403 n=1 Tax=Caenorhabditis briggsae TaxID=6238 RepID=B6IH55_CAEBR|nr:Protein CBG25403 [Caenorhabditis briggsae]CAR99235.1 Protein CBG25403 [Caenorhabditis briggsae]